MGRIVISCYRPKLGKEEALDQLVKEHLPTLRGQELATDREPIVMRAEDGTVVEVFEWRSAESIEAAHKNPEVIKLWERFGEVCEFIPVADIKEAENLFSEFSPFTDQDRM